MSNALFAQDYGQLRLSNALFAQDYGQLHLSNAFTVDIRLCTSKLDWNFLEFRRVVQYPLCQKKIVFYTALEQCFLACTMRVSYRAPRGHLAYSKCTIPAAIAQRTRPRAWRPVSPQPLRETQDERVQFETSISLEFWGNCLWSTQSGLVTCVPCSWETRETWETRLRRLNSGDSSCGCTAQAWLKFSLA